MHPLRIVASLGVVCVVATLPFQALRAQSAASRQLIAGFADSVNVLPTLRAVDSVATKWSDKQPGGMNEIRRGLLEWHEGHLSGERDHYEAAVSQFERAARRARVWPYPWYLLGRMRLEMLTSGFKVSGVTQQRGAPYLRYYDEARRNLDRSLELDPTFGPTLQFRKQFAAWFAWLDGDVKASFEDATPEGVGLLLGQAPVPGPTWTRPNVAAVGETGAPDARRALEALRDTLAGIMVIADLPSTAVPWSPTRTARDSVWLILRSAFIAFRAADLTDDTTRYLHARERFREARNRLPGLPYGCTETASANWPYAGWRWRTESRNRRPGTSPTTSRGWSRCTGAWS